MNISIGENNTIEDGVIIKDNVIIGNNNIIKTGTVIYENTTIGDNNVILENNTLGSLVVDANLSYQELKRNGLVIGNNNFFHIQNTISSGFYRKTVIGNHNKFLSQIYISHDNVIHNHVTFYPKVFTAGLVEIHDYANLGAACCVHQKTKIGSYSMIGMNSSIVKHVLPFMINVNNKYTNVNDRKIINFSYKDRSDIHTIFKRYVDIYDTITYDTFTDVLDDMQLDESIINMFKQIISD